MWQRTPGAPKTRDFPKNGCSENGCSENEGFSKVARVWGRPSLRCIGFGCRDMWCLLVHFSATPHCPYPLTRVGCIWARYKLDFCLAFAASASLGLTTSQRPPDIPGRKGIIAESGSEAHYFTKAARHPWSQRDHRRKLPRGSAAPIEPTDLTDCTVIKRPQIVHKDATVIK